MPQDLILIVEDSPVDALITKKMIQLTSDSCEVKIFDSGKEAKKFVENEGPEHLPRLVLLDMNMPDLGGLDFLKEVNKSESWSGVPIVAISSHYLPGEKESCKSYGISKFLEKPLAQEEVKELFAIV
ncbi:MAG: response regulator [Bacteroidota bacterium]